MIIDEDAEGGLLLFVCVQPSLVESVLLVTFAIPMLFAVSV